MATALTIPRRFCGPPTSGNGGYVAGRLAALVPGAPAVQVTLRQPPLLETPLQVAGCDGAAQLSFGGAVVAEARPRDLDLEAVEPVPYGVAVQAGERYAGLQRHPFPTCFVCGTGRSAPDGLGLRPGPLSDRPGQTAAAWRPDAALADGADGPDGAGRVDGVGRLPAEMVWAALDCPGGWTLGPSGRPAVLGSMTAAVDALPYADDECVVTGRLLGTAGRKSYTATTLYDGDGRVLARAHAVWITIDPTGFPAG